MKVLLGRLTLYVLHAFDGHLYVSGQQEAITYLLSVTVVLAALLCTVWNLKMVGRVMFFARSTKIRGMGTHHPWTSHSLKASVLYMRNSIETFIIMSDYVHVTKIPIFNNINLPKPSIPSLTYAKYT